jgi:ferric-dicitrate binding protein FerR (iron transport regulator)
MNIQEVRPFVASYVSGNYSPQGYEVFLEWLENASVEELDLIAKEYEALHEGWMLPEGPTAEWMQQLEEKLDRFDRLVPVKRMHPRRRIVWGAAASLLLLGGGAYLWHANQPVAEVWEEVKGNHFSVAKAQLPGLPLVLPDGSKVWLNSVSTLIYPTSFTGKARTVELTGEAYFEIAKNTALPFRVKVKDTRIEVLGTHFNVNGYDNEGSVKTTLLQGSVRVGRGSESMILGPGDQAETANPLTGNNQSLSVDHDVNLAKVTAWKNGFLYFEDDDLPTVMREVSRCYDVDIQYEGKIPAKQFSGKIERNGDIRNIYKILETQQVRYKVEGKTIIVMP